MIRKRNKSVLLAMFALITVMSTPVIMAKDASQYHKNNAPASGPDADMAKEVLIKNVSIFNGTSKKLIIRIP